LNLLIRIRSNWEWTPKNAMLIMNPFKK